MKTIIIALISAVCGIVLFASCCQEQRGVIQNNDQARMQASHPTTDFSSEKQQLQIIAVSLGCPQRSAKNMSLSELVLEIRGRLSDNVRKVPASGGPLSGDEWKTVRISLDGGDSIIEKIETDERILKSLRGKRILILPDDSSDSSRR